MSSAIFLMLLFFVRFNGFFYQQRKPGECESEGWEQQTERELAKKGAS